MRFVSPLLQTTSQSKGEPAIQIKWLNSLECYVLSAWRMPSWFVLISEYKSVGNKARREKEEDSLLHGSVQHSLTTVLYDTSAVVFFPCFHTSLTVSLEDVREIYNKSDILPSFPYLEEPWTNWTESAPHQKWPYSAATISSQQTHYQTNHLWRWEVTTSSAAPPLKWQLRSQQTSPVLAHENQGLKGRTSTVSCAPLRNVKIQQPNSSFPHRKVRNIQYLTCGWERFKTILSLSKNTISLKKTNFHKTRLECCFSSIYIYPCFQPFIMQIFHLLVWIKSIRLCKV